MWWILLLGEDEHGLVVSQGSEHGQRSWGNIVFTVTHVLIPILQGSWCIVFGGAYVGLTSREISWLTSVTS